MQFRKMRLMLRPGYVNQLSPIFIRQSSDKNDPPKDEDSKQETNKLPEEPTSCCMSGCPTCVWLDYAEKLSEYFKDGGEKAIKEINEKVSDPNIKAFLLHELRMRQKKT